MAVNFAYESAYESTYDAQNQTAIATSKGNSNPEYRRPRIGIKLLSLSFPPPQSHSYSCQPLLIPLPRINRDPVAALGSLSPLSCCCSFSTKTIGFGWTGGLCLGSFRWACFGMPVSPLVLH